MSNKLKVFSPTLHRKESDEEIMHVECPDVPDALANDPNSPISFTDVDKADEDTFRPKEKAETPTNKNSERDNADNEGEEFDEEKEIQFLIQELESQKKSSLLKNYSRENLEDIDVREDYFVLLCFISLYGGDIIEVKDLRRKSEKLNSMNYLNEKANQVLRRKEFISKVLVAAANQKEDIVIKEIIKNDSLGYIVSVDMVLAFLKADQHQLLKPLLKVVEANKAALYNLGTLTSMLPDNLSNKAALTANNMPKRGNSQGLDTVDPNTDRRKRRGRTKIENGMTVREMAGTVVQMANLRRPTIIDRELLPRSEYDNVIIEARFDTVFPHLINDKRIELVEPLIDYFGEKHINHLNLFIGFGQEELAMKQYTKFTWDLTEPQIIMLLERKMWKFLCNITDELEKMLFFNDKIFSLIMDMFQDGSIITEVILLFTTLPFRGWRQNQAVLQRALLELAKSLINEDPESSRLIYANNPIMTCAQISYLLIQLSPRFKFIQNEMEDLSSRLEQIAVSLQHETRENNLYNLYLTPVPTGLTMLDYIVQMSMRSLIETPFTKALILEFWDDKSSITGSRKNISHIAHSLKVAKSFTWVSDLKTTLDRSFSFQFGNVMNSPKILLFMDVIYYIIFFFVFDDYIYNKLDFFEKSGSPQFLASLPSYWIDVSYATNGRKVCFQIVFLLNYLLYFFYRCCHISRQRIGKGSYKVGCYLMFVFLSITLLILVIFPSYERQINNKLFIKSILVLTRSSMAYLVLATMLGFKASGELITILSTVVVSLIPILCLLTLYILLYSEIMYNFFSDYFLFNTSIESFFSLVEVLFGSLTFANLEDVDGLGTYYTLNSNLVYFAFSSNILATFLIIAFLSSILEAVRRDASYQNTCSQYYFLQMFTDKSFKGFYTFPPMISALTAPLLFLYRIPRLADRVEMFLLKVRFYIAWAPTQLILFVIKSLFYDIPHLYVRNIWIIFMKQMDPEKSRVLHLLLWMFFGIFHMLIYLIIDIGILLVVLCRNFEVLTPQTKMLSRITDFNVIYLHRYGLLKEGIVEFQKNDPDAEVIHYAELFQWLINDGKKDQGNLKARLAAQGKSPKEILAAIIKQRIIKTGGSKWIKNIHAAKKRLFKEILDGLLNYKNINARPKEMEIDIRLMKDLVEPVNEENVSYLRSKHVSSIQMVLLNTQSKEQITILNKIEELDRKIDILNKLWSANLPKYSKPSSINYMPSPL